MKLLLKGQLKFFNQFYDVIGISSPGKDLEEVSNYEGIKVLPVDIKRKISLLNDILSLVRLFIIIRKEMPTIVHTHTPKAGTIGMIAAWLCNVPVRLHTVAGLPLLETSGVRRKLLDFVERITYACATRVYTNSHGLESIILQNNYCAASKLQVIGQGSTNGIDTNYFSPQQVSSVKLDELKNAQNIKPTDFLFVFVGRLVKDKGIEELARAFIQVHQQYPFTKLLLVGNFESDLDPLHLETEHILNTHPAIVLTGYQNDVRPWLAISNVLVFPSYREGFPNVVMQAGAMGLPSIVTDINGCNEIISEGHNGILIPPKNVDELKKTMIRMVEDKASLRRLASNARESIVTRYEQQKHWGLMKEEYEKQLKSAGIIVTTKPHVSISN